MGFALPAFTSFLQPLRRIAVSMRPRAACPGLLTTRADATLPSGALVGLHAGAQLGAHLRTPRTAQAGNDPQCTNSPANYGHTAASRPAPRAGAAIALRPTTTTTTATAAAPARPLRVIVNRHNDKACRLVISGRMADVCAELNRLALS